MHRSSQLRSQPDTARADPEGRGRHAPARLDRLGTHAPAGQTLEPASALTLYQNGAKRMKRIVDKPLSPEALAAFAGEYHSDDLDVSYRVELVGDRLFLRTPIVEPVYREDWGITGFDPLVYDGGDTFALGAARVPVRMPLAFKRDAQGRPTAFNLDAGRVRILTFVPK